jgi:hypothetical protein
MNVDQVLAELFADEDSGDDDFPMENIFSIGNHIYGIL